MFWANLVGVIKNTNTYLKIMFVLILLKEQLIITNWIPSNVWIKYLTNLPKYEIYLLLKNRKRHKKILALKLEDLTKIPNLQNNETMIIIEFKNAVKNKQIIAFLSGYKENRKDG